MMWVRNIAHGIGVHAARVERDRIQMSLNAVRPSRRHAEHNRDEICGDHQHNCTANRRKLHHDEDYPARPTESCAIGMNLRVTDHLANERTFLAYVRTSLSLLAFGFVIANFAVLAHAMPGTQASPGP